MKINPTNRPGLFEVFVTLPLSIAVATLAVVWGGWYSLRLVWEEMRR